jgi:CheY-like chemotaxis protein
MHRRFNLVVIDDDEDDQFLIQMAFQAEANRYAFDFISDARGINQQLAALGRVPDLIFLDLNMPPISGFDVLRDLKQGSGFRQVPVIVLSTSNDEKDVQRCYALGANTYLVKPTAQEDFERLANIVRLYWFSLARMPRR